MAMEKTMTDIVDMAHNVGLMGTVDPLMYKFAIFILAIFIGYYVIWSVTCLTYTTNVGNKCYLICYYCRRSFVSWGRIY